MATGVIKFVGLLVMLNVGNDPKYDVTPTVVAVNDSPHHVAYIAFDSANTTVDSKQRFKQIPKTTYWYLPLDGVKVDIVGAPTIPGQPTVDQKTYGDVANAYQYWPTIAKNKWHAAYVHNKN